jgi:hypothetical protein
LLFVFSFLSSPTQIQDVCIQLLSVVVFGYVTLLHMQLFAIYPVLVLVPSLLLVAVVYVLIQKKATPTAGLSHSQNSSLQPLPLKVDGASSSPDEPLSISQQLLPVEQQHLNRRQSLQMGVFLLTQKQQDCASSLSQSGDDKGSSFVFSDDSVDSDVSDNMDYTSGVWSSLSAYAEDDSLEWTLSEEESF